MNLLERIKQGVGSGSTNLVQFLVLTITTMTTEDLISVLSAIGMLLSTAFAIYLKAKEFFLEKKERETRLALESQQQSLNLKNQELEYEQKLWLFEEQKHKNLKNEG